MKTVAIYIEPRWINCYERGAAMQYHESKDAADKWHHENSGENRVGCICVECDVNAARAVIGVREFHQLEAAEAAK